MNGGYRAALALIVGAACALPVRGEDAARPIKPYADIRYRLEAVDQDGLPRSALASTLRIRAGLASTEWRGLSAVAEGEAIARIGSGRYNDTINARTDYPVVADPEAALLNQAYLKFRPVPELEIVAGRQAVNLDNQRWLGSVGWRQNDQTLDAARTILKPVKNLSIEYLHAWRVNRVFGPDSPQGTWRNTGIDGLRIAYAIPGVGTVSTFGYWLDIPSAATSSSRTVGIRLAGERALSTATRFIYAVEHARQDRIAGNLQRFTPHYLLLEPGVGHGPFTIKAGYERLQGNGQVALQTPLATLHAFNGWADKFLVTPPGGLRDTYIDTSYKMPAGKLLAGLTVRAAWHEFRSTVGAVDYGNEWNAMLSRPFATWLTLSAKLAHYAARHYGRDTTKAWLSFDVKL